MGTVFKLAALNGGGRVLAEGALSRFTATSGTRFWWKRPGGLTSAKLDTLLPGPSDFEDWTQDEATRHLYLQTGLVLPPRVELRIRGARYLGGVSSEPQCLLSFDDDLLFGSKSEAYLSPRVWLTRLLEGPVELLLALAEELSTGGIDVSELGWRGWIEAGVPSGPRDAWLASFADRAELAGAVGVAPEVVISALETAWLEAEECYVPQALGNFGRFVDLATSSPRFAFGHLPGGGLVLACPPFGTLDGVLDRIARAQN